MTQLLLIQPGSTDLDDQRRIKGCLDMPLSPTGEQQVMELVDQLKDYSLDSIYSAPCRSARQTAGALAAPRDLKVRVVDSLCNLDFGLWSGKSMAELRRTQPRIYRLWQEHPESACPPKGESLASAQHRVRSAMAKLHKKHKKDLVALVVPNPLAGMVRRQLRQQLLDDSWPCECDRGNWELLPCVGIEPLRV